MSLFKNDNNNFIEPFICVFIFLKGFEDQIQLKFSDIAVYSDNHILSLKYKEKLYEKPVGAVSGYKCPVKHYQYYLSKW